MTGKPEFAEMRYLGFYRLMFRKLMSKLFRNYPMFRYDYQKIMDYYHLKEEKKDNIFPIIIPRLDKTPREAGKGKIYVNSTPELFAKDVRRTIEIIKNKPYEEKIIFLKSWNEWGEGNYMEPDLKWGMGYCDALKNEVFNS